MRKIGTEILVIGGGATGAGIALDAAMRGYKTILVEKGDLAHGATGRYHGLLHSGGRYVVRDPEVARECITENRILRQIMPEAIEDTGGFFVLLPEDDPDYADRWVAACGEIDIPVEEISPAVAIAEEPLLNPRAARVFRAPDAACDSFDALHALARGIRAYGGAILKRHRVEALIVEKNRVRGALMRDLRHNEGVEIRAELIVNATGPWVGQIAAMARADLLIEASKGTLLAYAHRLTNTILNRCAMPGDGDILVPIGTVSVIGTTSVHVDDPDVYEIEAWEIEKLRRRGEALIPAAGDARLLRAWAGVRPLLQEETSTEDERSVTRAHIVVDHATRDNIGRFISVGGGKFTTYRLMAEETVDLIGQKLGVYRKGCTAAEPLPAKQTQRYHIFNEQYARIEQSSSDEHILCECELVTREQLTVAIQEDDVVVLNDLRRDLRLGMGPCQGAFCTLRAAGVLREVQSLTPEQTNAALIDFLQARWKGIRPIATGHTARQAALNIRLCRDLLGLDRLSREGETEITPTERTS